MNLKEYVENNNLDNYILTDRNRLPIDTSIYKYLDYSDINVTTTEVKNDILHIYTDYIADSC